MVALLFTITPLYCTSLAFGFYFRVVVTIRARALWLPHFGLVLKTMAHRCIQSLGGVSMTDSEGLWPQLVRCAPHLSTVPLILDKVQ
jgi:hypothetical protein